VGDVSQSAIVRLPLDFATGIHRARVNPRDGQVYTVGLNGWNGGGRKGLVEGGIQRVRYTGASARLLTGVNVRPGGIELTFNFKLDRSVAASNSSYQLQQWNYKWLQRYGSDQWSVEEPDTKGRDDVRIKEVVVTPAGDGVFLAIPGIKPVNQIHATLNLKAEGGGKFVEEFYMTINRIPEH